VIDRLHAKKLVARVKRGRRFDTAPRGLTVLTTRVVLDYDERRV
jgi:hypothetical protein